MHGVLLTVAYDGTAFSGWAAQAPGESRTVEETVWAAVRAVDPRASKLRGVSRTDAGVHAEAQKAAFDATLEGIDARGWVMAVNAHLPDDVAVRHALVLPVGFNPRHASKWKRYRYRLLLDMVRDPLQRIRSWRVGYRIDEDQMRRACAMLEGTHDFGAFRTARDDRPTTVRTLSSVALEPLSARVLSVAVTGDAFMHNMVRIMVGTLVDVGRGKLELSAIERAFETKRRDTLGMTAPAHGLTLEQVELDLPPDTGASWPP
jgi:tRNA pseudouridine38-40 synthase